MMMICPTCRFVQPHGKACVFCADRRAVDTRMPVATNYDASISKALALAVLLALTIAAAIPAGLLVVQRGGDVEVTVFFAIVIPLLVGWKTVQAFRKEARLPSKKQGPAARSLLDWSPSRSGRTLRGVLRAADGVTVASWVSELRDGSGRVIARRHGQTSGLVLEHEGRRLPVKGRLLVEPARSLGRISVAAALGFFSHELTRLPSRLQVENAVLRPGDEVTVNVSTAPVSAGYREVSYVPAPVEGVQLVEPRR